MKVYPFTEPVTIVCVCVCVGTTVADSKKRIPLPSTVPLLCNMPHTQSWDKCNSISSHISEALSPAAPPGITEISLRGNVAYESYNRGKDQDDDQYEKLDEYKP